MFGAADGQPELGWTPNRAQSVAPSTASNAGAGEERGLHTLSRKLVLEIRLRSGHPNPVTVRIIIIHHTYEYTLICNNPTCGRACGLLYRGLL